MTRTKAVRAGRAGTVILIPVNNPLERILREIRRRTRVVGAFRDGQSRYLNIELLKDPQMRGTITACGPCGARP